MLIRRIEIRDFRKLGHVVIDGLGDGLNVIVGDNEAGKSTVLAALRAALFDRHRISGEAADAMRPYGQKVRPQVEVDFEIDGRAWQLRKVFGSRPDAELVGGAERLAGDAVEDRLAELLGFAHPGKGASRPELHQGLHGLLWVEQGRAHERPSVGAARGPLSSALESEIGQLVGGERGRRLIDAAEARRQAYWDKRDRPRGDYRALSDERSVLLARREEFAARLSLLDDRVLALEQCGQALAEIEQGAALRRAGESVEAARAAVETARGLGEKASAAQAVLDGARRSLAEARQAKTRREDMARGVEAARRGVAEMEADAGAAHGRHERQTALAAQAEARSAEAKAALSRADRHRRAHEAAVSQRRSRELLAELDRRLASALASDNRRRAALAAIEASTLTAKDLQALDRLEAARRLAIAQRDAASVEIRFEPLAGRGASVDGVPLDASVPLKLGRATRLALEGFGFLTILPGGDVEALAARAEKSQADLLGLLRTLGLTDIEAGRTALEHRMAAEREAAAEADACRRLAPEGTDALRRAAEEQRALLASAGEVEPPQGTPQSAALAFEEAAVAAQAADEAAASARSARERAGAEAAVLGERAKAVLATHGEKVRALAEDRLMRDDVELVRALAAAEEALAAAEAQHRSARFALEAAQPEVAVRALRLAEDAKREVEARWTRLSREKLVLETELSTLGHDGLGEQLAETEGILEAVSRRLDRLALEAKGAMLLHETLLDAQRETKERWLEPAIERAKPYLRQIHPDGDIVLDEESLELKAFVRAGREEPFENLSVGAREQVAVITRLAFADLLRAAGRPATVILDDALVNTDEGRLARMRDILAKAASSFQIIVLTCRESDFAPMDATLRRIGNG